MISEMDLSRGLNDLEDYYAGKFGSLARKNLTKNLAGLSLTADDWEQLIPYIKGKHSKRPSVAQICDCLHDIRGEGRRKGGGPRPPPKGTGSCVRCKGRGVVWLKRTKAVVFCGCDNSAGPIFYYTHRWDDKNERWNRDKTKDPPTLRDFQEAGMGLEHFEDVNRCGLYENREDQRRRNWEVIERLYNEGKYIPLHILKLIEGPDAKPRPMPKIGKEIPPPFKLDLNRERLKLAEAMKEEDAPF